MIRNSICLVVLCSISSTLVGQQLELPATVGRYGQESSQFYTSKDGLPSEDILQISAVDDGRIVAVTAEGESEWIDDHWSPAQTSDASESPRPNSGDQPSDGSTTTRYRSEARLADGRRVTGSQDGLMIEGKTQFPEDPGRRWAPTTVRVAVDGRDRIWFCCDQGAGCFDGDRWTLYTGAEGLPFDQFTSLAAGSDGTVWFGTTKGLIRFDGKSWAYRQGKRWLPHDDVRDVAVDEHGQAWVATAMGVAKIYEQPMTLAEKADFFQGEIDRYHRRTRFGYVIQAHAPEPGEKSNLKLSTSDNDGLWTSMYGAGECFAYGATKDADSRSRAIRAFEALRFLSEAPKGSVHAPPNGFIARTVLETSSPRDPNAGAYTLQGQRDMRKRDGLWRVYEPRWPKSADGHWYWKSDTSSDELDGHYFFYAAYYDLVASSEQQQAAVREVVRANIDHLIEHDFCLHDHAGRTRWAVYSPQELNHNPRWHVERGLNSLSMLSYLNVAHHITGDRKYLDVAKELRDKHTYHINALNPKMQFGIGSGNQSDDEMAFMSFYNLIKYEPDPKLRMLYLYSFANAWRLEEPEMNPFFNFCFAAVATGSEFEDQWGSFDLSPWAGWLSDSIETLKRFPLDRFDWSHSNSHRKDLIRLTRHSADRYGAAVGGKGYRNNGKVIPVDERHVTHWNHDPWRLDSGGAGHTLADGAVFTLPYYMGLYHGFVTQDKVAAKKGADPNSRNGP